MKKPLLYSAIALVLIIIFIGLFFLTTGDSGSPEQVLDDYFNAFFSTASVSQLQACLPDELHEQADLAFTLGGVSNMLLNNLSEVSNQLNGNEYTVSTTITKQGDATGALLAKYKQEFYGVSKSIPVEFQVVITDGTDTLKYIGSTDLVKIRDKWLVSQYSLPIYKK